MSHFPIPRRPRARTIIGGIVTAALAVVAFVVTPASPALADPPPPDPYQDYVAPAGCTGAEQPGVIAFRAMLQSVYGIGGGGIYACSGYEHEEGRALDFVVDASNPAQATIANQVLAWLLATVDGYPHAMARRLGIGNIIWNTQSIELWTYENPKVWEPYEACTPGVSPPGVCHTNHIHFAFSWAGALEQTTSPPTT